LGIDIFLKSGKIYTYKGIIFMKKSFAFAFLFCIVSLCGVCGFFLFTQNNSNVEITVAENLENGYTLQQTFRDVAIDTGFVEPSVGCSNLGANNGYKNYTASPFHWSFDHIIYDVVLMNFKDFVVFNEANYTTYAERFDEAAEYISTMSRGITTIGFNYYIYNNTATATKSACEARYNFSTEKMYIENGLQNGYCVSSCGEANAQILMIAFSGNYRPHTLPHEHVWYQSSMIDRIMIVKSKTDSDTIAHELLHTMGLTDLYNDDILPKCIDIMCQQTMDVPVNPYSRYKLGWLDESFANDGVETAIETLTKTGRYILNQPFSQTGTISYKFGAKNSEVFYIETTSKKNGSTLYIHKINTRYDNNYNARTESQLHVETIGWLDALYSCPDYTKITPTHNPIKYTNGEVLNVSIGNVCVEKNGQISFDFFYGDSANVSAEILVKDKKTKKTIPNVDVYINDVYQSTTGKDGIAKINATCGDALKLVADNYYDSSYYVIGEAINLETTGYIDVTMVSYASDNLNYKFEFTIQDNGTEYNVSPYDVTFNINNEIVKYNFWGINLIQGDKVKISSRHFKTLSYNFSLLSLQGTKRIYLQDDTFHITAVATTNNYYINLFNDRESLAEISKVEAYNSATNTWEDVASVSVVYKLEVPYYQIKDIAGKYTRFAFEYTACGVTSSTIVFLENDKYEYKQKLEKTPLQIAGDFVTSIGTSIKDFFGGLWK